MKKDSLGIAVGLALLLIFLATASYLASALSTDLHIVSITGNIYFGTISLIVPLFLFVNTIFTKRKLNGIRKTLLIIAFTYGVYEFVMFCISWKTNFAVSFKPSNYVDVRDNLIAPFYVYEIHFPFTMHLGYTYSVIATVAYQLIARLYKTPYGYRRPYWYVLITLICVILVNAVFLFFPAQTFAISRFDISLPGYYLLAFMIYYAYYVFRRTGMVSKYKEFVIDNVEQGVLLFDYEEKLILFNANAQKMLSTDDFKLRDNLTFKQFVKQYDLEIPQFATTSSVKFPIRVKASNQDIAYKCNAKVIFNQHHKRLGYLFVLSDSLFDKDSLTDFQSFKAFIATDNGTGEDFGGNVIISILDIDGLGVINTSKGFSEGDNAIKKLSQDMKKYFPPRTMFIRGDQANLCAVISNFSESEALEICRNIRHNEEYAIQYSVTTVENDEMIDEAFNRCLEALNYRKTSDEQSSQRNAVKWILQALETTDSDTPEHVERTKVYAEKLGTKLGLSHNEISRLVLLAEFHDIGKITIPNEILNKPSKLTPEEIVVIKSHCQKGFDIAISSPLLKNIANEIKYHHERWDGNGYPDGLKKESIPLLSRIVSVVDSYDAMTSDRCYKKGMSVRDAIAELKRCSGSQFDSRIVTKFIEVIKEDPNYSTLIEEVSPTKKEVTSNVEYKDLSSHNSNSSISYTQYTIIDGNKIVEIDDTFTELTGYTSDDIKNGLLQSDLIPEEDRLNYIAVVNKEIANKGSCFLEHRLRRKDGSIVYVFCYGNKYYDPAARMYKDKIVAFNVNNSHSIQSFVKEQEAKATSRYEIWENKYRTDPLTGLLSRVAFENDVTQEIIIRKDSCFVFIMMDIDFFKEFNDKFGHPTGDKCLITFANSLLTTILDRDFACRMGGDEFASFLVCPKSASMEELKDEITKLFNKLTITMKTTFPDCKGISMGVSFSNSETSSFDDMYDEADRALYEAKNNGKGKIVFHD